MAQLTDRQVKLLASPIDPGRVARDGKGFNHLQVWDIRRYLTRVFGFAGWGEDITDVTLISERHTPNGTDRFKHTVIYRVTSKLSLYATDGTLLTSYSGSAVGEAINQPSLADAHDLALKTAASQALKRAAHNLGDQFGLSLYNGGDTRPVVNWSVAYPKDEPVQPDPPVKADPEDQDVAQADAELDSRIEQAVSTPVQNRPEPSTPANSTVPQAIEMEPGAYLNPAAMLDPTMTAAWQEMLATAERIGFTDGLPAQFRSSFGVHLSQGTTEHYREATRIMNGEQV